MKKIFSVFAFVALSFTGCGLFAKPVYLTDMVRIYPGARLMKGCSICHAVAKEYTPYGNDFLKLKEQIGPDNMEKVWYELGRLDSDNDGVPNDVEIRRGRTPGAVE